MRYSSKLQVEREFRSRDGFLSRRTCMANFITIPAITYGTVTGMRLVSGGTALRSGDISSAPERQSGKSCARERLRWNCGYAASRR
jgi:hypothetical protein